MCAFGFKIPSQWELKTILGHEPRGNKSNLNRELFMVSEKGVPLRTNAFGRFTPSCDYASGQHDSSH